jgi:hypothetical protein
MDVERIIDDIEQLQEMFEAPDIRPLSATSLLRIEDTTKCSRIVRGLSFGSSSGLLPEFPVIRLGGGELSLREWT